MSPSEPGASRRLKLLIFLLVCLVTVVVVVSVSRRRPPAEETFAPGRPSPVEVEVGTRAVLLYFGSADGTSLVEATQEIMASSEPATLLASIVRELLAGPPESGTSTVPEGTQLISAYVEGGTAYLDFSEELRTGFAGGSTQEYILLASIVRTVSANFPDINQVQILVEGIAAESIGGHYDTSEPLSVFDWQ
ncbi:MAG: GerMN domain-containing protein [Candidatus Eiseniibacteriota bacterium]|nr:MAG: GerMN domain-containing protein [Candidatus Eisenbacteria bacterium]